MRRLKGFLAPAIWAVVISYLGYHALHGEQGYLNYVVVKGRIAEAEAELAAVRAERAALEDRVARLSPSGDGLDLDYVEERAREVLNFAHPDEIIVKIESRDSGY
ncbi:hypothetical protein DDZ18_05855 [Marinicauda salina]|uniref:Septum formation initiator family protein n=1 Tax=Marinicauda salina TaxID=2135793 RepID=A0A2U2BV04_9PROT|nr:septum formation initiator family protein [Marinicauda salina]PWE17832.1 hypothetical protein DDZ18_05855 [Marinicauda salina]